MKMNQQLENLYFLRDRVIPWMEEHPERVDFDEVESDCGTYRCAWGWYKHMRGLRGSFLYRYESEFGFCAFEDAMPIFGSRERGTLADRKERLNEIIARKEKELGVSKALVLYRPGADIVREMMRVSA